MFIYVFFLRVFFFRVQANLTDWLTQWTIRKCKHSTLVAPAGRRLPRGQAQPSADCRAHSPEPKVSCFLFFGACGSSSCWGTVCYLHGLTWLGLAWHTIEDSRRVAEWESRWKVSDKRKTNFVSVECRPTAWCCRRRLPTAAWLTFSSPNAVQFHNGVVEPVKPRSLQCWAETLFIRRWGSCCHLQMRHLARSTLARLWAPTALFWVSVCLSCPFPKRLSLAF